MVKRHPAGGCSRFNVPVVVAPDGPVVVEWACSVVVVHSAPPQPDRTTNAPSAPDKSQGRVISTDRTAALGRASETHRTYVRRRYAAWRMNAAPSAIRSQFQKSKPISIPSPMLTAMMRANAAMVPQLRTGECESATLFLLSAGPEP